MIPCEIYHEMNKEETIESSNRVKQESQARESSNDIKKTVASGKFHYVEKHKVWKNITWQISRRGCNIIAHDSHEMYQGMNTRE